MLAASLPSCIIIIRILWEQPLHWAASPGTPDTRGQVGQGGPTSSLSLGGEVGAVEGQGPGPPCPDPL